MKRPLAIVGLIIVATLIGYYWWARTTPTLGSNALRVKKIALTNPVSEEQDIYEAVFRYRIAKEGYVGAYFLSINGSDPSDAFLARFADVQSTPLKKASATFSDKKFPRPLRDKITGEVARVLFTSSIKWMPPDRAEVYGGRYCGGLCLDSGVYYVVYRQGRWTVEKYEIRAIA